MKKIIFTLFILALIPLAALAWDDCPYNEVDCPSPGDCDRYVDIDNDEICDRSQLTPEDRNDIILAQTSEKETVNLIGNEDKQLESERIYRLVPISLILIFLYVTTHILSKKKIINIINHRKIWNILLLLTFVTSGISGILLVIRINFGISVPLQFNLLFWHVETGIAMFAISMFHILWHWAYFKNMLNIKK